MSNTLYIVHVLHDNTYQGRSQLFRKGQHLVEGRSLRKISSKKCSQVTIPKGEHTLYFKLCIKCAIYRVLDTLSNRTDLLQFPLGECTLSSLNFEKEVSCSCGKTCSSSYPCYTLSGEWTAADNSEYESKVFMSFWNKYEGGKKRYCYIIDKG